jgi:hypothetical protein
LTSDAFSIQFPVQAPSIRSLFFQKNTLNIPKDLWINALEDGVTNPAFEENCYETGFNVGDPNYVQARIGIVNLNNPGRTGRAISYNLVGMFFEHARNSNHAPTQAGV